MNLLKRLFGGEGRAKGKRAEDLINASELEINDTNQGRPESKMAEELLAKLEAYAEAMHYLRTCGSFDGPKFEKLDTILGKVGSSFGKNLRSEMVRSFLLSVCTPDNNMQPKDAMKELKMSLTVDLARAFKTFNDLLFKTSPTPQTAERVRKIIQKYHI